MNEQLSEQVYTKGLGLFPSYRKDLSKMAETIGTAPNPASETKLQEGVIGRFRISKAETVLGLTTLKKRQKDYRKKSSSVHTLRDFSKEIEGAKKVR